MGTILEKEKNKNSRLALVSFILGLIPILCIICITIKDILFPIGLNNNNEEFMRNTVIEVWIFTVMGIIGMLIAINSLLKKKCSKKLGVWAIILNSIIPVFHIATFVLAWINIFVFRNYK